jgi:hypothetical protein
MRFTYSYVTEVHAPRAADSPVRVASRIGESLALCNSMTPHHKGIHPHNPVPTKKKGTGPDSAGQSGDTQGIDDPEQETLLEEGQFYEAELIEAVEDAPPARRRIRTRQVPDEDVPLEYHDQEAERDEE